MMTDEEKTKILRKANDNLRAAGFDNVVILANEGGTHGIMTISSHVRPALMRFLMASYFMDETMDNMVEEHSSVMIIWKPILRSILETIVPEIRKLEEERRNELEPATEEAPQSEQKETDVSGPNPFSSPLPKD